MAGPLFYGIEFVNGGVMTNPQFEQISKATFDGVANKWKGTFAMSELDYVMYRGSDNDKTTHLLATIEDFDTFGISRTSGSTNTKTVTVPRFILRAGKTVSVRFTANDSSSTALTLNVNGTGAAPIVKDGVAIPYGYLKTEKTYTFRYIETAVSGVYAYELTGCDFQNFVGATASANGSAGLVPAPAIEDRTKFLKADGGWQEVGGYQQATYSVTGSTSRWVRIASIIHTGIGSYSGQFSIQNRANSNAAMASIIFNVSINTYPTDGLCSITQVGGENRANRYSKLRLIRETVNENIYYHVEFFFTVGSNLTFDFSHTPFDNRYAWDLKKSYDTSVGSDNDVVLTYNCANNTLGSTQAIKSQTFLRNSDNAETVYNLHQSLSAGELPLLSSDYTAIGRSGKSIASEISEMSANNDNLIPNNSAVIQYVGNVVALKGFLEYKGTIGTGGTITSLPSTFSKGDVYRVITADTYVGHVCEVGDFIAAVVTRTSGNPIASDWTVWQGNIDGSVTTADTLTANKIILGNGNKTVKTSTYGISNLASLSVTDILTAKAINDNYLGLSGGTLSGALTLHANATANMHAVPKQQMDTAIADVNTAVGNRCIQYATSVNAVSGSITMATHGCGLLPMVMFRTSGGAYAGIGFSIDANGTISWRADATFNGQIIVIGVPATS